MEYTQPDAALPSLAQILQDRPLYLDELIDPREAAEILDTTEATLATRRCRGGGPPFVKDGNRCKYTRRWCLEHARARLRRSTSDPGPQQPETA
jgi:hypothetical protein